MKRLIPCNSSLVRVDVVFYFKSGETTERRLHIPKTQTAETLVRLFDLNPDVVRVVATAGKGKVIFDKRRGGSFMTSLKQLELQIRALQRKHDGRYFPDVATIELIKDASYYPPKGADRSEISNHVGEYCVVIGHWDGKPGTGDQFPTRIEYAKTIEDAEVMIDEYVKSFPPAPFPFVILHDDYRV